MLRDENAQLPHSWHSFDTVLYSSFCAQLDLLKADGWRTLRPEALNKPNVWSVGQRQILFTFDDGHESDLLAAAALAARGYTATFFIPWVHVGQPHFLDRQSVKQLSRDGFGIGSHGMTHSRLTAIGPDRLRQELEESKARLEDLVGRPITDLAIPFGSYDQRVLDAARGAGYATIMTSDVRHAALGSKSRVFPRLPVKSFTTLADFLTLVGGSDFAVFRWRLAINFSSRVRAGLGQR
jgi:peptidoglycan/xylan/chitin deacetylase (PgdA/CDA1 family)